MMPPVKTAAELAYSALACFFSGGHARAIRDRSFKKKHQAQAAVMLTSVNASVSCCLNAKDLKSATLI